MRIRFLSAFEPGTTFYRDLLPFLAERGLFVELMIGRTQYRTARNCLGDSLKHPRIQIKYNFTGKFKSTNRLRKAYVYLNYTITAAIRTLLGPPVDLNFFLTQPPLFFLWGYVLKLIRGQRYCILVMDVYPDVAVKAGLLRHTALLTRFFTRLSRFGMKHADSVITIGRCMKEYLREEGIPKDRIHVIVNWTNEKQIFPVAPSENRLRRQLGLEDEFVVLYSGNMGVVHFFDDLLEVARRLHEISDLRFVFIGDGIRRKEIERAKDSNRLFNILLLPFQPDDRLAESLSLGDVHFVSLREGFEGLVVPSKAYGALAAGRPIIYQGNKNGEIARLIVEEQVGTVVSSGDVDTLERVVLRYYRDRSLLNEQGKKARELVQNCMSHDHALKKYESLFRQLLSDKN